VKASTKKPAEVILNRKILQKKIGELIRELRIKKGLSQKQAADRCGCSLAFWKRYEKKGFEGIPALLKIAVSLGGTLTPMIKLLEKRIPLQELSTIPIGGTQDGAKRDMDLPEIESYLKKEDRIWVKEKLQALAWLAQGMKVKEVRKRLGRSHYLIQQWLCRYNKTGVGWVLKSSKVAPPREPSEVWKE
jgi:transcriptional regulator with XRE-family HTH domain